ncbi:MAG: hypothetical protein QOI34_178 [Verrucomicrobiota bacterium]
MVVASGSIGTRRRKRHRWWCIVIVVTCILAAALLGTLLCTDHRGNRLPIGARIDRIVVEKSLRKLSIFRDGEVLKNYQIALGQNPIGPKAEEGDMKTPEGTYRIDTRNPNSAYHLALHISYPSDEDNARAAVRGVSAGSDIMIHGLPNGERSLGALHRQIDWIAGCIALTNDEIEELWRVTPSGTVIEIKR